MNLLFVFMIVIIIIKIYNIFNREGFKNANYKKTIYLVWNNKLKDSKTTQGFGDKIRGALFLYQYCKKNKINLKINGQDDVCGDYLNNVNDPLPENKDDLIIINNTKLYNTQESVLNDYLINKKTVFIYTNEFPINDLSKDDKLFAKHLCKPKKELHKKINTKIQSLPLDYGIQHFRFNDIVFTNDIKHTDEIFIKAYNILKNTYKSTDVLISNSLNFKKYAMQNLNIKTIDNAENKLKHIGESTDNVEYSFIEFFICCKAKYINTYTTYNWPSNFVYWPSKIYDIQLTNTFI